MKYKVTELIKSKYTNDPVKSDEISWGSANTSIDVVLAVATILSQAEEPDRWYILTGIQIELNQ